jgi:excisionase family DNA binding protein
MQIQANENRYLGFRGAARYLGVSIGTVHRLADSGQIRCYRIADRLCRFDRNELDALVRGNAATATEISDASVM